MENTAISDLIVNTGGMYYENFNKSIRCEELGRN